MARGPETGSAIASFVDLRLEKEEGSVLLTSTSMTSSKSKTAKAIKPDGHTIMERPGREY